MLFTKLVRVRDQVAVLSLLLESQEPASFFKRLLILRLPRYGDSENANSVCQLPLVAKWAALWNFSFPRESGLIIFPVGQVSSDKKDKLQLAVIFSLVGVRYYSLFAVLGEKLSPFEKISFLYMWYLLSRSVTRKLEQLGWVQILQMLKDIVRSFWKVLVTFEILKSK